MSGNNEPAPAPSGAAAIRGTLAEFAGEVRDFLQANRETLRTGDADLDRRADEILTRAVTYHRIYSAPAGLNYGQVVGPHADLRGVLNCAAWTLLAERGVQTDVAAGGCELDDSVLDRMLEVAPEALALAGAPDPDEETQRRLLVVAADGLHMRQAARMLRTLEPVQRERLQRMLVLAHNDHIDPSEPLPAGWERRPIEEET